MTARSIAIMQPYFIPYIVYFQLIARVDKFVVFDDVNYIPRGWVNRNNILLNGSPHKLVIPVSGASQNTKICDMSLSGDPKWREKVFSTLMHAYKRSKYYQDTIDLLRGILFFRSDSLSDFLVHSLRALLDYLAISTEIVQTSRSYCNSELRGVRRIHDICIKEAVVEYLNLPGGESLYDRDEFEKNGINLKFIQPRFDEYTQLSTQFIPALSIVDVIFNCGRFEAQKMVQNNDR